ncbi:MAG: FeoA family protein [Flavobacterium sp.]|jgi:ferrous iron transport protein A
MEVAINTIKMNQKYIISSFDERLIPLKIIELGCLVGNSIQLIGKAPLGDPLLYKIDENRIAIRKNLAQIIYAKPI